MKDIIVEIMVEVLMILAIATKAAKSGRLSELVSPRFTVLDSHVGSEKYWKKLTGNTDIEDSLDRLDRLTQEEARMASVELLKTTHNVDDRVKGVEGNVLDVRSDVQDVDNKVQRTSSQIKRMFNRILGVDNKLDEVNRSLSL
jgi:peptidoglycan hydrolase CwlO-like protein